MHYLLFLMMLVITSCKTPKSFFNRPDFELCIANGDGTAFCDGVTKQSQNMICTEPEQYKLLKKYYDDKEYRLFKCLAYGKCF